MRVLLIDNWDSFTWNLAQLCASITGELPRVVRNDEATVEELLAWRPERVILSPGPGRPENALDIGVCAGLLARGEAPVLGVCLGLQAIAHACGARIVHAPEPFHGRLSTVEHDGSGCLAGLPPRFRAVRYHSLVVERASLPPSLRVSAWTEDGLIMGLAHTDRPFEGVQFHPESILTEHGRDLLARFLSPPARTATPPVPRPVPSPVAATVTTRTRALPWVEPEAAFLGLYAGERFAFWLDSAAHDGRWSYLGAAAEAVRWEGDGGLVDGRAVAGDAFSAIGGALAARRTTPGEAPFMGGLVGYLGYELRRFAGAEAETVPRSPLPEAWLLDAVRLLAFDHRARRLTLIARGDGAERWLDETAAGIAALPPLPAPTGAPPVDPLGPDRVAVCRPARGREQYRADIARAQALIRDGETYEACLTTQVRCAVELDPLALYRSLRRENPAPYAAYLRFGDVAVLSSSPERFVHVDAKGAVESRPIKGTRRRGATAEEDLALGRELAGSEKDRAENLMIVDLVRNDLGRVCLPGSVHVPSLFEVETHPSVLQLVSTVRGQLDPGIAPIECVRALFPGGSMTGAPKRRTMRILDQLEGAPRGVYAGGIGFFEGGGELDLAMAIRTIVWRPGELSYGVGGAIVAGSDADAEWDEAMLKGHPLVSAIAKLSAGCTLDRG